MTATEIADKSKSRTRSKNRAANQAALQLLCDAYPDVFNRENMRPLKIGIQEDLIADEKLAKNKIKRALASYVRSPYYFRSLKEGADRIGLDALASGAVTESEAEHAKQQLKEINKLRQQKQQEDKAQQRVKQKEERLNNKLEMLLTKRG
ncbi:ProQ/FINO family protein [Amphritea japonica]|uniref:Solute/DNA competence effector protein n=1 Tax=Amphritea japonica ATCC BAA-1530 TaxID=1278309 RepID=A0A7R6PLC9_9GAMM|nr:ProQ/FinO family protein [Amphritea japonica]BBB26435.1 solute/DNA competence effector protein [Amphritea japonica ATCC BAA-1530]